LARAAPLPFVAETVISRMTKRAKAAACRGLRRNLGSSPVSLKRKAAPGYCFKRLSRIGAAASRKGRIREP
jgi:hypothetical protein